MDYRINTPVVLPGGGPAFSFINTWCSTMRRCCSTPDSGKLFPLVSEAVSALIPLSKLRYLGLSHFEADECGAINQFLAAAPQAVPVCSQVAAMIAIGDQADRARKRWPTASSCHSAATPCAGSTHHMCRTDGSAGS